LIRNRGFRISSCSGAYLNNRTGISICRATTDVVGCSRSQRHPDESSSIAALTDPWKSAIKSTRTRVWLSLFGHASTIVCPSRSSGPGQARSSGRAVTCGGRTKATTGRQAGDDTGTGRLSANRWPMKDRGGIRYSPQTKRPNTARLTSAGWAQTRRRRLTSGPSGSKISTQDVAAMLIPSKPSERHPG
jgi:hypothetical protein